MQWISQNVDREPIEYESLPDAPRGQVIAEGASFLNPSGFVHEAIERVEEYRDENPEEPRIPVMILATCGYMLKDTIKMLRKKGMPFCNPYRPNRRDWNPLGALERGVTSAERLTALARTDFTVWGKKSRFWNWSDLKKWTMPLGKEAFKKGARKHMDAMIARALDEEAGVLPPLEPRHVKAWLKDDEVYDRFLGADYQYYISLCQQSKQKAFAYPASVADANGLAALVEQPLIVVGTVHSVKGGEADHVYVYPDIARSMHEEALKNPERLNECRRLFYVAITRCSKSVRIGSKASAYGMGSLKQMAADIMLNRYERKKEDPLERVRREVKERAVERQKKGAESQDG